MALDQGAGDGESGDDVAAGAAAGDQDAGVFVEALHIEQSVLRAILEGGQVEPLVEHAAFDFYRVGLRCTLGGIDGEVKQDLDTSVRFIRTAMSSARGRTVN